MSSFSSIDEIDLESTSDSQMHSSSTGTKTSEDDTDNYSFFTSPEDDEESSSLKNCKEEKSSFIDLKKRIPPYFEIIILSIICFLSIIFISMIIIVVFRSSFEDGKYIDIFNHKETKNDFYFLSDENEDVLDCSNVFNINVKQLVSNGLSKVGVKDSFTVKIGKSEEQISKFGESKYECTGSCFCDDVESEEKYKDDEEDWNNERRSAAIPSRGLVYAVSAVTSLVAFKLAKKYFSESCIQKKEEDDFFSSCNSEISSIVEDCVVVDYYDDSSVSTEEDPMIITIPSSYISQSFEQSLTTLLPELSEICESSSSSSSSHSFYMSLESNQILEKLVFLSQQQFSNLVVSSITTAYSSSLSTLPYLELDWWKMGEVILGGVGVGIGGGLGYWWKKKIDLVNKEGENVLDRDNLRKKNKIELINKERLLELERLYDRDAKIKAPRNSNYKILFGIAKCVFMGKEKFDEKKKQFKMFDGVTTETVRCTEVVYWEKGEMPEFLEYKKNKRGEKEPKVATLGRTAIEETLLNICKREKGGSKIVNVVTGFLKGLVDLDIHTCNVYKSIV